MSFWGKNIRKIRIAKKLSQTAFADLFGLQRTTVGAYEEGRAEAKIETLIAVSDFFGISVDSLIKKELTVNEILRFNENYLAEKKVSFINFTNSEGSSRFFKNDISFFFKNSEFVIELPHDFSDNSGINFLPGDILFCSKGFSGEGNYFNISEKQINFIAESNKVYGGSLYKINNYFFKKCRN